MMSCGQIRWQSTWQSGQVGTLNRARHRLLSAAYTNVTFLTNSVYRFIEPFGGYSVPGFIPTGANRFGKQMFRIFLRFRK